MPASYRREVEYDRTRTSCVNPPIEDVEQAIADAEVAELLTGIDGEDYRHVLEPEYF